MRPTLFVSLLMLAACPDQKLGTYNTPPAVSITSPADGTAYDEGTVVDFAGLVSDSGTAPGSLVLTWASDIDGTLSGDAETADSTGLALFSTGSLSVGNHAITLSATDEEAERSEYTIGLTITDVPDNPVINIVHPAAGESGEEGEAFEFVATVSDEQDAPETLLVYFESDVDGTFCTPMADSIGVASCAQALSAGDHRLTFRVVDSSEPPLTAYVDYYFSVVAGTAIDNDGDGYNEDQGDCNDTDASVNPIATEYYNDRDDDCDGLTDNGTVGFDDDADGQTELDGDCDDADVSTYEGAPEACDDKDNDCDSIIDETTSCYDDDGDGLTETDGDCNDDSAISYPGAAEVEDGNDNDCDGVADEGTNAYDDDFDGYTESGGDCNDANGSINPAATEACDGADNDCDSTVDETNASGCTTYYYDYDGDGYGSDAVSGVCMCSSSGYYNSGYNSDCYDYNSSASPAASAYSTSHRGDGSYDWNCDGSSTKYWTNSGSCASWPGCGSTSGWYGGIQACGSSGNYLTSCSIDWFSCDENTSTYTQKCI